MAGKCAGPHRVAGQRRHGEAEGSIPFVPSNFPQEIKSLLRSHRQATSPILHLIPIPRPRRHGSYAKIRGKSPFTVVRRNGVHPHPLDPVVSCSETAP